MGRFGIHYRSLARHTKAPRKYKFENRKKWLHHDMTPNDGPIFLLRRKGKAMTVLEYETDKKSGALTIGEIQRTSRVRPLFFFSREAAEEIHTEDVAKGRNLHEKAGAELGMHTSEFIFREFLYRHRDEILSGRTRLILKPSWMSGRVGLTYHTLINRYFKKISKGVYELNLDKKRTKELLFQGLVK